MGSRRESVIDWSVLGLMMRIRIGAIVFVFFFFLGECVWYGRRQMLQEKRRRRKCRRWGAILGGNEVRWLR